MALCPLWSGEKEWDFNAWLLAYSRWIKDRHPECFSTKTISIQDDEISVFSMNMDIRIWNLFGNAATNWDFRVLNKLIMRSNEEIPHERINDKNFHCEACSEIQLILNFRQLAGPYPDQKLEALQNIILICQVLNVNKSVFSSEFGNLIDYCIKHFKLLSTDCSSQPLPWPEDESMDINKALQLVDSGKWHEAGPIFQRLAQEGGLVAQHHLGVMYTKGWGVGLDQKKAFSWFKQAADGGFAPSQFSLGLAYYKGEGIAKDLIKAVEWFKKAAEQGHPKAQFAIDEINRMHSSR